VNFGIALLNPLVISVGMLCGIPLNAGKFKTSNQVLTKHNLAIDIVFRHMPATVKFLVGAILIIISFVLCAIPIREMSKRQLRKHQTSNDDDA
jgi:hypothetical protein